MGKKALFDEPKTREDTFLLLAHDLWMEYHAERYSILAFTDAIKSKDPKAKIDFNSHKGYAESFINILEGLPDFINTTVLAFQNWEITMKEFWPSIYLRLRETLLLASFTSAHYAATGKDIPGLADILDKREYQFFFDVWNDIEIKLSEIYSSEEYPKKAILMEIGVLLMILFERCGITIDDTPEGIYVNVNSPVLD